MEEENRKVPIGKKTALVIVCIWIVGLGIMLIWLLDLLKIVLAYFSTV